jgi:rhomboid protease GluP
VMKFALWLLDKLTEMGVNTTRWRWKLHKYEQRIEQQKAAGPIPTQFHWIKYQHKICQHCGAMVDGASSRCPKCDRWVPSLRVHKILRLLGLIAPTGGLKITYLFLGLMGLTFIGELLVGGASAAAGLGPRLSLVFGGMSSSSILDYGQYWRILSFGIVHGGLLHIFFNAMALMQIGPLIEDEVGRLRVLFAITFTQITAAGASIYWYHDPGDPVMAMIPTVGASGWVFGLVGFGITFFWGRGGHGNVVRDVLVRWAVYCLLFGFMLGGVNNAAHIGGAMGGMLLGVLPMERKGRSELADGIWPFIGMCCAILWLIAIAFMGFSIANHVMLIMQSE